WVQVGPDWTCVKSRIFTPSSALPSLPQGLVETLGRPLPLAFRATTFNAGLAALAFAFLPLLAFAFALATFFLAIVLLLLLLQLALRVEVADAAAFAASGGIDHGVDERGLARIERRVDGALQLVRRGRVDADAAERLHHLVVARALHEHRGGGIASVLVDVGAAIDAVIVEDDDADREAVPADRLDLHAGETECRVAFDRQHLVAGFDGRRDRLAHADAHDAPGADVEPLAGLVDVDHAARQVERVGAFVDQDRLGPLLDDGAQHAERAVIVHRVVVVHQARRHLGDVLLALGGDGGHPLGRALGPAAAHLGQQSAHARADIAHDRRHDLDVAVHLLGLDVDLDELLRRIAPGLALAVAQEPIEAGADHHHHVRILEHGRARGARALRMRVGQQALGHAHRQERHARLLDEALDRLVGLRVGRALAEDDQRLPGALQDVERALHGGGRGDLRRRGIDHLDQRPPALARLDHLAEQLGRQVEIDAARAARHRGANGAGEADADILGMKHAIGRLAHRLGDRELVHLLVVALLQVDDVALRRARHQDHREAVGGGMGERRQAVQEARRGDGEADAGLVGEEARDRRGIARVLLVAERQHADARRLRHAAEIGDGNARHAIDGRETVQLQGVDQQIEAVGQLLRLFRRWFQGCFCHWFLPVILSRDSRRAWRRARRGRGRAGAPAPRRGPWRAPRAPG